MRLLLDEQLSRKRLVPLLERRGHDVLAVAGSSAHQGLADEEVLELAAVEGRVLVTRNSRDFAPILREWAEARRHHAGCVLIWSFRASEHAAIARELDRLFDVRPRQDAWRDLAVAL